MDPAKLKVVELRAELSHRGLETKGNKAVLVERLRKALEEETGDQVQETTILETDAEDAGLDTSLAESPEHAKPTTPVKAGGRSARSSSASSPAKTPSRAVKGSPVKQPPSPAKVSPPEEVRTASPVPEQTSIEPIVEEPETPRAASPENGTEITAEPPEDKPAETEKPEEKAPEIVEESPKEEIQPVDEPAAVKDSSSPPEKMEEDLTTKEEPSPEVEPEPVNSVSQIEESVDDPPKEDIPKVEEESKEETESVAQKMEEEESTPDEEEKESEENVSIKEEVKEENKEPEVPGEETTDKDISSDCKTENVDYLDHDERTPKREEQDVEMKDPKNEEDSDGARDRDRKDRRDRKRKRSTSPQQERYRSPPPAKPDDEPEIDDGLVLLSWYDSDLNLVINKDNFCSATPMHSDGFGYIWAGVRASFGFRAGKLYFETKVTENCTINLQDEDNPHVLRVGWSVAGTSTQLGEEKFSYGYGGTGKISTNCKFEDYGKRFGKDDVVGCYADLTGETDIRLSFTVNGEDQGVAFTISKEEIGDVALYPHVLTKNCTFGCNFGQEEPWSNPILEGYISVGEVDPQERIPGPRRPEKREDCEMLLMCGLPSAGKTQWALNYTAQHPEKMYNILGTNTLIDKMKVMGLPRKRNYHGRWDVLIDKCTRALNKLLEIASTRRRNYILDQTNVYPTAQRRKMRHFYGFQRKAVVVVPTDEEFKLRTAKRIAIEGKDVPDSAVLEMKANFTAPTVGESFESVEYVELDEEESKKLIEKYNKEGKDAGFSQQQINKRPRFDKADSHRDSRDSRSSRDSRDSRDHRDRRGGYPDRNRNAGGWRGGNNGGGWRDRPIRGGGGGGGSSGSSSGGGGHPRHGSGYSAPSSGGGWRGGRGGAPLPSHRGGNDRRGGGGDRRTPGGNDRNRGSQQRQGGGWGAMGYQGSQQQQSGGGWGQQGGWTGSQSQTGWGGQQGGWGGQQQWGGWKGFGQNSYGQGNYSQQNYGNGNWGGWNQQQQYYNQYWGSQQQGQQQQQQSGQAAVAGGGQAAVTTGGTSPTNVSTTNTAGYGYPQGAWQQGYTQAYALPAQTTTNTHQAQQQK